MSRFIALVLALSFGAGIVGCDKKAKVETKTTVTSPEGTTTKTDTSEIKTDKANP
jgi:hypothetical protein